MATATSSITIYTSPTCPHCRRAKQYLDARGVTYRERDVSVDREAADEMIRLSRQRGVPVIEVGGEVVVGFNQPLLERLLSGSGRLRLGASVADAARLAERGETDRTKGAYVGAVRAGSVADQGGLHVADVIISFGGRQVQSATHLQQLLAGVQAGHRVPLRVVRDGRVIDIVLAFG